MDTLEMAMSLLSRRTLRDPITEIWEGSSVMTKPNVCLDEKIVCIRILQKAGIPFFCVAYYRCVEEVAPKKLSVSSGTSRFCWLRAQFAVQLY